MIFEYAYINSEGCSKGDLRQRQSLAAVQLLDEMLKRIGIYEYKVERDKNGRPFLSTHPNIDFNYSHSGEIVVCVLSVEEGRVGVDVERSRLDIPLERRERFVKRFFSENEQSSAEDIVVMWTRKEAYLKYIGTGFSSNSKNADPTSDSSVRVESFEIGEYTVSVCLDRGGELSVNG